MPGLPRQVFEIPFTSGLLTKGDKRAKEAPALEHALNLEFDDIGGLRVRFPFGSINTNIVGGGTLANARKLTAYGNELVCFTDTALYSWNASAQGWLYKGDHLAVAVDEQTVFAGIGDQFNCDRAELNGVVFHAWQETGIATSLFLAATDKATGAVIAGPMVYGGASNTGAAQPKLVALQTCVMLVYAGPNVTFGPVQGIVVTAAPLTLVNATITIGTPQDVATVDSHSRTDAYYDAVRVPGQDWLYLIVGYLLSSPNQECKVFAISNTGATTSSVAVGAGVLTYPTPVAIAISADAQALAAFYSTADPLHTGNNGTYGAVAAVTAANVAPTFAGPTLLGDWVNTSTLAQITAATVPNGSGTYKTTVFWSLDEADDAVFVSSSTWINVVLSSLTVTIGTAEPFVFALGLASRAFLVGATIYVWGVFAGLSEDVDDPTGKNSQLQNTYYLYRSDGLLVSKAAWGEAGGFQARGFLPTVYQDPSNANAYSFCGQVRRVVPITANPANPHNPGRSPTGYAERAPRDVTATFDDNRARRCIQFGQTLYISGGLVLQYDGAQLAEVGFATYPWLVPVSRAGSGPIPPGEYTYYVTDRWTNAKGEVDRSTSGTVSNLTFTAGATVEVDFPNLYVTRKSQAVAIEIWRTTVNPVDDAALYLASSLDPSQSTGDNCFVVSNPNVGTLVAWDDVLTDDVLGVNTASPENDDVLEYIEPPGASVIMTDAQRIYLAGIPGYPNSVYYSHYKKDGEVATFHDALSFEVPADGGAITGLVWAPNGALVVFCETATYAFTGPGFDDTGGGANFQIGQVVSYDLGALSQESVIRFDDGYLVKTAKGWFVLDKGLNYNYIGETVYRYDDEEVLSSTLLTDRHQIRVLTSGRMLVFDTVVKQWGEWSVSDGVDTTVDASGVYWYLTATGPKSQLTTWDGYSGGDSSLTTFVLESTWVKPAGNQQGRAIVDYVQLLGEFRSSCAIRVQLAKDYEQTSPGNPNWHTDRTWTPFPTIAGNGLELRAAPMWKRCASVKVRITMTASDGTSPLTGPAARLTSLTGLFALEPGIYSAIAAAQKQ